MSIDELGRREEEKGDVDSTKTESGDIVKSGEGGVFTRSVSDSQCAFSYLQIVMDLIEKPSNDLLPMFLSVS